jgi:hypothetical protein
VHRFRCRCPLVVQAKCQKLRSLVGHRKQPPRQPLWRQTHKGSSKPKSLQVVCAGQRLARNDRQAK